MKRIQKFSVIVRQNSKNGSITLGPNGNNKSSTWAELTADEILPVKEKDKNKEGYAKTGLYKITVTPDKKGDWQIKRNQCGNILILKIFSAGFFNVCEPAANDLLETVKGAGQLEDYLNFGQAFRCKIVVNKIKIPKKKRGL